jgi:predicted house-cleaning noncanonical NTP pyrophosphatase (MazG superfamily)
MPKASGLKGWGVDDHNVSPNPQSAVKFDKLVRDKIPQIMRAKGKRPKTHVASAAEYKRRLAQKLMEEAIEYANEPANDELADVLEVVYALCIANKTPFAKLEKIRKAKAQERGSFKKRIVLDSA